MLTRDKMQLDYSLLFDEFGYRTTILYQLASGILTGKYNNVIPKEGRFGQTLSISISSTGTLARIPRM